MSKTILTKLVEQYAPETVKMQLREIEMISRLERRVQTELQKLKRTILDDHIVQSTPERVADGILDGRGGLGYDLENIIKHDLENIIKRTPVCPLPAVPTI